MRMISNAECRKRSAMTPATRERLKALAAAPQQQDLFGDFLQRKKTSGQNG